ncbi:MAG: glucosaminidase domain-containing protein [Synergistaceae bacterium]|nr:glucosaminidase domain-containing protein [Synergistaceae bacterium]
MAAAIFVLFSRGSASAVTAEEFYAGAQKIKNINAFAATVQSAHETEFWTSFLWKNAMNGAGIKADKKWRAAGRPHILKKSPESVGGKIIYRESYFRVYKSLDEFLGDYGTKITRDYPLAVKHSGTAWGYFASLQKGRLGSWATTKKYFEYMTSMAFRLAPKLLGPDWKEELLEDFKEARRLGILSKQEMALIEKKFSNIGVSVK